LGFQRKGFRLASDQIDGRVDVRFLFFRKIGLGNFLSGICGMQVAFEAQMANIKEDCYRWKNQAILLISILAVRVFYNRFEVFQASVLWFKVSEGGDVYSNIRLCCFSAYKRGTAFSICRYLLLATSGLRMVPFFLR